MWYLLIAVIGSSSLVIILKLFADNKVNLHVGITVNYIVAAALSFFFYPQAVSIPYIFKSPWITAASIVGIMFALSFVVFALSAQRSGVAVTTISGRAAVVIPVTFAFLFLGDRPTTLKITLLALILVAMYLILNKPKKISAETDKYGFWVLLLPLAVFLMTGANDTTVQYAQNKLVPITDYTLFNGTMFVSGAVTGLIVFLISCIRRPHIPNGRDLLWGFILGFMNWVCMTGVLNGLDVVSGSIFFPIYYTGAIVISTVVGVLAFKEKLSRINYIGIGIAVCAIAALSTL